MKNTAILLLISLICISNYQSNEFIDKLRKKLGDTFILISGGDPTKYLSKSDIFKVRNPDSLHGKLISRMVDERANLKMLYSLMYNSLVMSINQDCLTTLLASECQIFMEHMEDVLKKSLDNEDAIANYVKSFSKENMNDIEAEGQEETVTNIECDFYDPVGIFEKFLTRPRAEANTSEDQKIKGIILSSTIDKMVKLIMKERREKYDMIIDKCALQLANMKAALYGEDESLKQLIEILRK